MNKKIKNIIRLILGIILATIIISMGYKWLNGTHIQHFKQYIIPCQGRISVYSSGVISFYILDEENFSELSNKENILQINLIENDGTILSVDDWNIQNQGSFYNGNKYSAKQLDVVLSPHKTSLVHKLEIIYPDKTEYFDIGSLTINLAKVNNDFESYTQIFSNVESFKNINNFLPENIDFYTLDKTMLHFQANSIGNTYIITEIDLGIPGLGIDPSTLKAIPQDTDFGKNFTENLENEVYFSTPVLEQLPTQDINIKVESRDYINMIISLAKNKEYEEVFAVYYYAPVYTCVDEETNIEYQYSNINYMTSIPQIQNDEFAEQLLEEYGQ